MDQRYATKLCLQLLDDLNGVPQGIEDLREHVSNRVRLPVGAEIERAMNYLEQAGYAERCEATAADDPLWRATAKGMRQIRRQVPRSELDPMVHKL